MKFYLILLLPLIVALAVVTRPLFDVPSSNAEWRGAAITFLADGATPKSIPFRALVAKIPPERISANDHYYGDRQKHYRALPLEAVLREGFSQSTASLRALDYRLRATDGFEVIMPGDRLLEGGAYIAFEDIDVPGWEPIGREHANPGPLYVVWTGASQQDITVYPHPWHLAAIEIANFDVMYPHVTPVGEDPTSEAMQGFGVFRDQCLRCHSVNYEGGRIGPDLNVPQSIVEYRPEEQIRAYIRDPLTFRYGNMPAHPHLMESDLDHVIAYFHAMKTRKHIPSTAPQPDSSIVAH